MLSFREIKRRSVSLLVAFCSNAGSVWCTKRKAFQSEKFQKSVTYIIEWFDITIPCNSIVASSGNDV